DRMSRQRGDDRRSKRENRSNEVAKSLQKLLHPRAVELQYLPQVPTGRKDRRQPGSENDRAGGGVLREHFGQLGNQVAVERIGGRSIERREDDSVALFDTNEAHARVACCGTASNARRWIRSSSVNSG